MILVLLYLLKLAPGSVLILPDSSTLLQIIRRALRLSRPIEKRVSRILDLIKDLLTERFFLIFRWVPGHRNPTESLLYYGNSQADLEGGDYFAPHSTYHGHPLQALATSRQTPSSLRFY